MKAPYAVTTGVFLALVLTIGCAKEKAPEPTPAISKEGVPEPSPVPDVKQPGIDFATRIQPMLVARCSPCHFPGGKVYEKLPFDRAATIRELGDRMFTRIKDEPDAGSLHAFLDQLDPD